MVSLPIIRVLLSLYLFIISMFLIFFHQIWCYPPSSLPLPIPIYWVFLAPNLLPHANILAKFSIYLWVYFIVLFLTTWSTDWSIPLSFCSVFFLLVSLEFHSLLEEDMPEALHSFLLEIFWGSNWSYLC